MIDFLKLLGINPVILGVVSICSILGFILTVVVTIRTAKISRILQFNDAANEYNKERQAFQKAFDGHRSSILEDNNKSDKLLKDILALVESYDLKFHKLLSARERFVLWRFKKTLMGKSEKVDFNSVCNYLAKLSGRLSKKEENRHG